LDQKLPDCISAEELAVQDEDGDFAEDNLEGCNRQSWEHWNENLLDRRCEIIDLLCNKKVVHIGSLTKKNKRGGKLKIFCLVKETKEHESVWWQYLWFVGTGLDVAKTWPWKLADLIDPLAWRVASPRWRLLLRSVDNELSSCNNDSSL
jgi:hypothetical protein